MMKRNPNKAFLICLFIAAAILIAMFLPTCKREIVIDGYKSRFDSLQKIVDLNELKAKEYKDKADTITIVKTKVMFKYVPLRDTVLIRYSNDTLIMGYVEFCDSLNELNNQIIVAKDSVIAFQDKNILTEKQQIAINLAEIKENKKQLQKQKRKTFLVGAIGVVGVIGTSILLKR